MRSISLPQFELLAREARIKPRLRRDLRFAPDTIDNWEDLELLAVADRNGDKGVLLLEPGPELFVAPYELNKRIADQQTGRSKAVICDFCYTWQTGGNAGRITFTRTTDLHTFTFLCCADLACSLHVRTLTKASLLSRAQLHEDLTNEQRVVRLKTRLQRLADDLHLFKVSEVS